VSLVKPNVKSGSRGFIQNLFYKFWTFLQVYMNFGNLKQFLLFKTIRKTIKSLAQYWAETGPRLQPMGRGGLLCAVGRNSREATPWRLGPAGRTAHAARGNARAPRTRSVVTARAVVRSTAAWWGLAGGKVLPASTGGVPGWRRARRSVAGRGGGRRWWSGHGGRRRRGPSSAPQGERE
jgi:hypothetical protein